MSMIDRLKRRVLPFLTAVMLSGSLLSTPAFAGVTQDNRSIDAVPIDYAVSEEEITEPMEETPELTEEVLEPTEDVPEQETTETQPSLAFTLEIKPVGGMDSILPNFGSDEETGTDTSTVDEPDADDQSPDELEEETPESEGDLSEESDFYTRDLLYDKDSHKQFITIQDRAGNTFYIIIDYDSPVDEDGEQYKTYFLNPVDSDDMSALTTAEEETPPVCSCTDKCFVGSVNTDCEICASNMSECAGTEPEPEPEPEPEEPETEEEPVEDQQYNPIILLVILAVVGAGLILAYRKFLSKPKPQTRGNDDLNDYDFGDDDDSLYETGATDDE